MRLRRSTPRVILGTTVTQPQKALPITIGASAVLVSLIGIIATYFSGENARKDRFALEERATTERAFLRRSEINSKVLASRIDAVDRLQRAYSNLQSAYMIFIRDYGGSVIATAQTTIELEIALENRETSERSAEKENEALARSGEKVIESIMLLRNEFVACALVFNFKEPNIEFVKTLIGKPLWEGIKKHLALARNRMTPIYRKARKMMESTGKLKADFAQEITVTTVEILAVIQDDLLADALEIETKYSAFYKKCWESIIDTKQEKADDILTASPTP